MRVEVRNDALLIRGRIKIGVVADLHMGLIPYFDRWILQKLKSLGDEVDELIVLGDLKHKIGYDRRVEDLIRGLEFTLVKGNHDGGLKGEKELFIGKFHLIHGHFKPKELGKVLILAHSHPSVYIHGVKERVWLFGEWKGRKVIVMPAFNELCSSTPVNVRKPAGFIFKEWDYFNADVLTLDGIYLGKSELLRPYGRSFLLHREDLPLDHLSIGDHEG